MDLDWITQSLHIVSGCFQTGQMVQTRGQFSESPLYVGDLEGRDPLGVWAWKGGYLVYFNACFRKQHPPTKKALLSVAFSKLQQKTKLKPFLWGDITAKMKHVLIRKRLCTLWKNKRENCENIWFYVCHVCLEYNISWFCNRQIQIDLNFSMLDNYQKHAIHMETHSSLPLGSDYH